MTLHVADLTLEEMTRLTVADAAVTAADGATFHVAGHVIDQHGRPYLAGLRAWRVRDGAEDTDTLFPVPTVGGLARLLREARTQLGLPVAEPKVAAGTRRGVRATTALGLSLKRLPTTGRPSPAGLGAPR